MQRRAALFAEAAQMQRQRASMLSRLLSHSFDGTNERPRKRRGFWVIHPRGQHAESPEASTTDWRERARRDIAIAQAELELAG